MDKEALKKSVNLNLRCVTQSCKGGVPLNRLEKDYKDLIGKPIPVNDLGYNSIELFLRSIPDVVCLKRNKDGQIIVEGVADASTAHIAKLISQQKCSKKGKGPSKKPSLPIRKYSCHESWRSLASNSAGVHKQDNKASVSHPVELKMPALKTSNTELINSAPKTVATTNTKSLTNLQSPRNGSQNITDMQQGTSQSYSSMLVNQEITKITKEALVPMPNSKIGTALSKKGLEKRRKKMREAGREFIKNSGASLTKSGLQKIVLKAQKSKPSMTTQEFIELLKKSLNSPTLMESQDPIKNAEQLPKEKLKSLTMRNLWNVTFRFEGGLLLSSLPREYMALFGTPIPYKDLGYTSLIAFIKDIPDVIHLKKGGNAGEYYAEAVRDTTSQTSSLASQQKEVPSTSNESINYVSQNSWETSSDSSSNTSKIISVQDMKTPVQQTLERIKSVLASCATYNSMHTKASIPPASIIPKPVLPSFSQPAPSETAKKSNLSKLGYKPTLNSIPRIKYSISSAQFNSLLLMNFLLYGEDSYTETLKRGILAFDGFPFSEDSDEWKQKQLIFLMLSEDTLKECLKLLCIECDTNNKHVLVYKLMQFLSSPSKALSERK